MFRLKRLNVQIVLDFAYTVTNKRCKNRTLDIVKLKILRRRVVRRSVSVM